MTTGATVVMVWEQARFMAEVSGRVVQGMDRACRFAVGVAQGKAPVATGKLRRGIGYQVVPVGDVVEGRVGQTKSGAFYGRFVELGTKKMPARPHIRPAVFENAGTIVKLIEGNG